MQWAAVTTQFSLIRDPPQKWKPLDCCGSSRQKSEPEAEEEEGSVSTHLKRHLPGPGVRDSLLAVDDPGVAAHPGGDGGNAAAWGEEG